VLSQLRDALKPAGVAADGSAAPLVMEPDRRIPCHVRRYSAVIHEKSASAGSDLRRHHLHRACFRQGCFSVYSRVWSSMKELDPSADYDFHRC